MMKKIFTILSLVLFMSANAQDITWIQHPIDGHRSGVTQKGAGETEASMGRYKRFPRRYFAPNGRKFKRGTTRKVAKIMIEAQDSMAYVKEIIAYSPRVMEKERGECALTNWYIDALMQKTSEYTGKHIDVGLANYGGVRIDMPEGDIFRDDIMSMFPFSNTLYYFTLTGESLLEICNNIATRRPELFGGMRLVIKDQKLVSATINGEPIDPEKTYSVATINYLMSGVSWYRFGKYAIERLDTKKPVLDAMLEYVADLTRQGKNIEYEKDGRYTVITDEEPQSMAQ